MKCPECVKEGKKSKILVTYGERTLMAAVDGDFYDEDGNHHRHDPNTQKILYRCSNGHKWSETVRGRCPHDWCEWNKG